MESAFESALCAGEYQPSTQARLRQRKPFGRGEATGCLIARNCPCSDTQRFARCREIQVFCRPGLLHVPASGTSPSPNGVLPAGDGPPSNRWGARKGEASEGTSETSPSHACNLHRVRAGEGGVATIRSPKSASTHSEQATISRIAAKRIARSGLAPSTPAGGLELDVYDM
jgi:hypothetical protein